MRGQLSQGLVLPLTAVPESALWFEDLSETLGILKWEPELASSVRGQPRGNFPFFVSKTDQERIQNIPRVIEDRESRYEVSLKLDGSSMTCYIRGGEVGVCSRNLDLRLDESNQDNAFVKVAKTSGLLSALERYHARFGKSIAVQGELMGPGIQGNRENLPAHELFVFDIWDIDEQRYMGQAERHEALTYLPVRHIPLIHDDVTLDDLGIETVSHMLALADVTRSLNHPIAEGLVFKEINGQKSWKAISNRFLLKEV
jgi:RNA ligase (TIGR02306 family)